MVDVRQAGPDDAGELMELRAVMLQDMDGSSGGDWAAAGAALLRAGLGEHLTAFVVDRDDRPGIAACAVGQIDQRLPGPHDPTGRRGYVYNVATRPAYRRRGYSRACLEAVLAWFDRQGVDCVDLRASPDGEALYISLGFTRTAHPHMRRVVRR